MSTYLSPLARRLAQEHDGRAQLAHRISCDDTLVIGKDDAQLPVDLLEAHVLMLGQSRRGKSKALELMLRQLAIDGYGFTVIDPHGSLAREAMAWLAHPKSVLLDGQTVHFLRPADRQRTFGLNVLKTRDASAEEVARVAAVCEQTIASASGLESDKLPRLSKLLNTIFTVLAQLGEPITSADFMVFAKRKDVREWMVAQIENEFHQGLWEDLELLNGRNAKQYIEYFESVVSRLLPFANPILGRILGQKDGVDPLLAMERGDIVLLDLSGLSEKDATLIGRLFTSLYLSTTKLREPGVGKRHFLIIDEADVFLSGNRDLAQIVDQGAKFGLSLVCSLQRLGQARAADDYVYSALMNMAVKIVFGIGDPDDAKLLADVLFVHELYEPVLHSIRSEVIGRRDVWRRSYSAGSGEMLAHALGKTDGTGTSVSRGTGRALSSSASETHARSTSRSEMHADSTSWSHGRSTGGSHSLGETAGWSEGENWGEGQSSNASENWSHMDGAGTSLGVADGSGWSSGTTTGQNHSTTSGANSSSTLATSSGVTHTDMFLPLPDDEAGGFFAFLLPAPPPAEPTQTGFADGMSQSVSESATVGSSMAETNGTSLAQSQGLSGSRTQSVTQMSSAADSRGGGRGVGLSHNTGGSRAVTGSTNESWADNWSDSESVGGGQTHGSSIGESESVASGHSTGVSVSEQYSEGESHSQAVSRSQSTGRSRTTSTSWVEDSEEIYGSYYSQFYSLEDQRYLRQALLLNLERRACVVKVEGRKALLTQTRDVIEHYASEADKADHLARYIDSTFAASDFMLSTAEAERRVRAGRDALRVRAGFGPSLEDPKATAPLVMALPLVGREEWVTLAGMPVISRFDDTVASNLIVGRNLIETKDKATKTIRATLSLDTARGPVAITGPVVKRQKLAGSPLKSGNPVVAIEVVIGDLRLTASFVLIVAPIGVTHGVTCGSPVVTGRVVVDAGQCFVLGEVQ